MERENKNPEKNSKAGQNEKPDFEVDRSDKGIFAEEDKKSTGDRLPNQERDTAISSKEIDIEGQSGA